MKPKPKALWEWVIVIALAVLIPYTYHIRRYWMMPILILVCLLYLLRRIFAIRAEHEEKEKWKKVEEALPTVHKWKARLVEGYISLLSQDLPSVRNDVDRRFAIICVLLTLTQDLRYWQKWVVSHPANEEARMALIGICNTVIQASKANVLGPADREKPQRILDELAGLFPAERGKTSEPLSRDEPTTCGSCNRQNTYKGKDDPVIDATKKEIGKIAPAIGNLAAVIAAIVWRRAMYCRACGRYFCFPCALRTMGSGAVYTECEAKMLAGKGKCPCCGALSVGFEQ
jgi:hypothetical protein